LPAKFKRIARIYAEQELNICGDAAPKGGVAKVFEACDIGIRRC
jgi:hypothetical protein